MVAGQVTPKRKETAFRRGRVLELRLMGETHPEIADELGIRLFTVKDDLRLTDNLVRDSKLRKALGEVLLKGWTSPGNVDERRGRVLALVREGKTPLEIAGELGVSQPTVSRDLRAVFVGQVPLKRREIAFRCGRVLELKLMGKTQNEIADELHVSQHTVHRDLEFIDNLVRDSKLRKALGEGAEQATLRREEIAFRRGRVLELRLMGKMWREIADELHISKNDVQRDLRFIDEHMDDPQLREALEGVCLKGVNPPEKQKEIDERRGRVLALACEGKNQFEIAGELGVSQPTVSRDLRALKYLEQKK